MESLPSCSFASQDELEELKNIGVNVWGQKQEVLEQQALEELNTFNNNQKLEQLLTKTEETNENDTNCDLKPVQKTSNHKFNTSLNALDINSYLKRQEELKKRQDYKRSLELCDKSKLIADQINSKQLKTHPRSQNKSRNVEVACKRKRVSSEDTNIVETLSGSTELCNNDENDCEKSGSEYIPSDQDSEYDPESIEKSSKNKVVSKRIKLNASQQQKYEKVIDDGNIKSYNERLSQYYEKLESDNQKAIENGTELPETEVVIGNNAKCSSTIWNSLYQYQREGVEWLWEINQRGSGGLLGDEMGLGKTVQIIAFLYSLNYTRRVSSYGGFKGLGPTLIVCPSTVIHQWVKHFHDWAPEFRVSILHQSGSFTGNRTKLIKDNVASKGILVTTYQSMLKYKNSLTQQFWHYIILDEGHKIRNPSAKISEAVKLFKTPHRLLLTGSPMQNNLQELWSLFDFVNPGMLGTLQVFMEHFAMPIMHGGYSNATPMQEALALSMATALKNMISPYLLRRAKIDVKDDIALPGKSEQVLFCSISPEQRDLYKGYLMSDHISNLLGRSSKKWFSESYTRGNVLMSITTLRKICNHPDIYLNDIDDDEDENVTDANEKYGHYKRSGKMIVVAALLKMWKKQSHRVLLFTQSRAMVAIFERFLALNGYKYLKMDGGTSIVSRQPLIDKFNNDTSFDVFLLTTRVGGLGVNLTGADRVIIYDPDWNPATDTQARERAWRIGQDKAVTIYRLIAAGTIEEKMYQRQIWKQLLSNKVLLDPKTQRFFKSSDLHDLFSLQEHVDTDANVETTNIFQNSRISLEKKLQEKKSKRKNIKTVHDNCEEKPDLTFSDDKIEKMKQLAAQIAKNISKTTNADKGDSKNNSTTENLDLLGRDLIEERNLKLENRAKLKKLTPVELLHYNRDKLLPQEEEFNQFDDCETDVNFTKALVISEKAADLYKTAKNNSKCVEAVTEQYKSLTQVFTKEKKHKNKKKYVKLEDDFSGNVEGEQIEGVVKRQAKKIKETHKKSDTTQGHHQDNYILSKLFSKKGVQSALQHDNVVQCKPSEATSIKVHSETQMRTDLALQALRRSRIKNWQW